MWYSFELFSVDGADGLTLAVGPSAKDVDDLLLAGADPFHGTAEDVGVADGYKQTRCHHRCHFLKKKSHHILQLFQNAL